MRGLFRLVVLVATAGLGLGAQAGAEPPVVSIGDVTLTEGSSGTTIATFTMTLSSSVPILAPMPVISRNVPAYASASRTGPSNANDDSYDTRWRSVGGMPVWIAYDLSGVAAAQRGRVVVLWTNDGFFRAPGYDGDSSNCPASYTIDAHAAAGGTAPPAESDAGWVELAEVMAPNPYGSRQHVVDLTSGSTVYNWLRMRVTEVHGSTGNWDVSINLDVHDAHMGVVDDWLFLGDSITAEGMNLAETVVTSQGKKATDANFPQIVAQGRPGYFPAQQNGGVGGWSSWDALAYIDEWLASFPGHYVAISYGSNDAVGLGRGGNFDYFYQCYEQMVQKVIAAGKIPVIPTIPWSRQPAAEWVPELNAKLGELLRNYPQIVSGPDLWAFFESRQGLISSDDLHPNARGYVAYRRLWAETMLTAVYQ